MNENYLEWYGTKYALMGRKGVLRRLFFLMFVGFKLMFDRLVATFGLIVLSPLMILISIIIKLDSKGPALFKQERTGKNGVNFYVYKFRTMTVSNDVHDFSKKDEKTRVGKILRKTSLDELPQLISIATGKMSFIGPRPWIPDYYKNMNNEQRRRYSVRPGLTGLAQANGRNNISIFDKINYDLEYVEHYSLLMDIRIVFLTIKAVFTGSGADAGKGTIKNELDDLRKQNRKKKVSK